MRFASRASRPVPGAPGGAGGQRPAGTARGSGSGNRGLAGALQALGSAPAAATGALPPQVRVSEPGDREEVQADQLARTVLAGAAPPAPHTPASTGPVPDGVLPAGPGEPLPAALRAEFEQRFGADLSLVRLHRGEAAAQAAAGFEARAYAAGPHLVFGRGEYAPDRPSGRHLIAHELAHVLQGPQGAEVRRIPWTPTHADERTASGSDRLAARTFELSIPSLTGLSYRTSTQNIDVSIFVPAGTLPDRNKVHIFFSPGNAVETGLVASAVGMNAAMTHGLRGAADTTEWILISVPGRSGPSSEANGFNTIDTAGVQACLRAAGRTSTSIDALRYSSHSRGSRGLRETLSRRLIPSPVADRVVVFDAAFSSLDRALAGSGIAGSSMVALNVVDPGRLSVIGSRNISLGAGAMRAIGYTRIIQDAMVTQPSLAIPAGVSSQLLTLPARGRFTTTSPAPAGMTNINDFARTNAAAIRAITAHENDAGTGLKTFIDTNNLIRLGTVFSSGIYSHHLFVAELAHEVVD
jgi:hypothetical protein